MKKYKFCSLILAIILICTPGMGVLAAETKAEAPAQSDAIVTNEVTAVPIEENTNKPFLALGADLTPEQLNTVLGLMGLSQTDLPNYTVVSITNDQEHQYLDAYVSASVIGTKSLSSVIVKKAEKGHGVVVSTKNISYCTTGMYRNALLTAGVEDADIMVVGPTMISGTAGLIGALKAYEAMSGETIPNATLDTALNELVTTGEIAAVAKSADSEDVEALIAYIKAKLANGELKTDDDIRKAIEEGEAKFGVDLTDEEIQKIIDVMHKINSLGLDPEALLNQAQDLYNKFGDELLKNPEKAIGEIISSSIGTFFKNIGNSIVEFFKGLFK